MMNASSASVPSAGTGGLDSPTSESPRTSPRLAISTEEEAMVHALREELAAAVESEEVAANRNKVARDRLNSTWAEMGAIGAEETYYQQEKMARRWELQESSARIRSEGANRRQVGAAASQGWAAQARETAAKQVTSKQVQDLRADLKARAPVEEQLEKEHEGLRRRVAALREHAEELEAQRDAAEEMVMQKAANRLLADEIRESATREEQAEKRASEAWLAIRRIQTEEEESAAKLIILEDEEEAQSRERAEEIQALQQRLVKEERLEEESTDELRESQRAAEESHKRAIEAGNRRAEAQRKKDEMAEEKAKAQVELQREASRLQRAESRLKVITLQIEHHRDAARRLFFLALVTICVVELYWKYW